MRYVIFILCAALPVAAASPDAESAPGCETLLDWMTGSFSSEGQAAADSAYFDIRLEVVRIWTDRDDAYWLYVEQAVAGMTDRPYRQRVYRVKQLDENSYESAVFTLPDPQEHAGAWREDQPLCKLSPENLELRSGCAVFLRLNESGEFAGGTAGRGCGSDLHGASYATSEVVVGPDRMESWDRGFKDDGTQVWGAEKGAYIFIKNAGSKKTAP